MTSLIPKILFFTFEWSSARPAVEEQEFHFLLCNKLTKDIPVLFELIERKKPDIVVGFSNSWRSKTSFIESRANNIFHKTKKVTKNGPEVIPLTIPKIEIPLVKINISRDDTFCNYVAYKVAYFCQSKGLKSMHIHNTKDQVRSIIEELSLFTLE